MKLVKRLPHLITFGWLAVSAFALLAYYVSPKAFWPPIFFGLGYPIFIAINLLFFVLWMGFNKKMSFLVLVVTLLGWPQLKATVALNIIPGKTSEKNFRVMTYNVHCFDIFSQSDKNVPAAIKEIDYIVKQNPDILCLQEARDYRKTVLKYLNNHKHFKYSYLDGKYTTIYSKYPILDKGTKTFPQGINKMVYIDVKIGGKRTRIINVHLESIRFSRDDYEVINEPNLKEKSRIRTILRKIRTASYNRQEQVAFVRRFIDESPYPVILCGDFNDTPASHTYRQFTEQLNDSFTAKGFGLGTTFAGPIPGLRIDYVMADKSFEFINHQVKRHKFSDHYPVIVDLVTNK